MSQDNNMFLEASQAGRSAAMTCLTKGPYSRELFNEGHNAGWDAMLAYLSEGLYTHATYHCGFNNGWDSEMASSAEGLYPPDTFLQGFENGWTSAKAYSIERLRDRSVQRAYADQSHTLGTYSGRAGSCMIDSHQANEASEFIRPNPDWLEGSLVVPANRNAETTCHPLQPCTPDYGSDPGFERANTGPLQVNQEAIVPPAPSLHRPSASTSRPSPSTSFLPGENKALVPQSAPLKCPHGCEATFGRIGEYRRHMKKHDGPGEHCCSIPGCERRFHRRDKLRDHLKQRHRHTATQ